MTSTNHKKKTRIKKKIAPIVVNTSLLYMKISTIIFQKIIVNNLILIKELKHIYIYIRVINILYDSFIN